ncbi:arrestin domain-containing protein A-like isoform X2 [Physella acuta]|uniref:arrestin domain-containing protein A-like isoform X2 n=1 Tax=Physella acuta TaxID=109671 RepID=UPI0027DB3025|nr:arrestin domain-containing protein A-like isoform X2 [Physella acuta]
MFTTATIHMMNAAVYLLICRPTEANGVIVSFKGIETCIYEYEFDGKKTLRNDTIHVDFSNISLFSQTESFQFGAYVFPFRIQLPKTIPGTFQCTGKTERALWNIDVSYTLRAQAVGADGIMVSQQIVVYQAEQKDIEDNFVGSAADKSFQTSWFPIQNKKLHLTVRLVENWVETGSNLQLKLIVSNPSRKKVTGFTIKLLRYLKLAIRDNDSKTRKVLDNMEFSEDEIIIAPESGPHLISSLSGESDLLMNGKLSVGLDKLQIPLVEKVMETQIPVPPTVTGKHVKNQYGLEISIKINDLPVEPLTLHIPGILPKKNKEWLQWTPPHWTSQTEVKQASSVFNVPDHLLRTEAFSGLPPFQVL